jgi:probable HAF family extracellular repeat protein
MNIVPTNLRHLSILTLITLAYSAPGFADGYEFRRIAPPNSIEAEAHGLNARGVIVGRYVDSHGVSHGFRWYREEYSTIDVPDGALTLAARGINARGDIIGNFLDDNGVRHGYLLSNGRFTQIDYPGASDTGVEEINNAGDIMGVWFNTRFEGSGFIRKQGKFHNVSVPGATGETVRSAQDNGRVLVGTLDMKSDGGARGFIRHKSGEYEVVEYPGLAVPCSGLRYINQRGDILGGYAIISSIGNCHPPWESVAQSFLLRDGDFTILENFPGSSITEHMNINDDGVIIGRYINSQGRMWGFRATPKP